MTKIALNNFELILVTFISETHQLVTSIEHSLNEVTVLPQLLGTLLGKANASFQLYCRIRKLYTESSPESVKKEFRKMCEEYREKQLSSVDISRKLVIGPQEFLVDVKSDPFAICFENWFKNHVEAMLRFILEITEQVRRVSPGSEAQSGSNVYMLHYLKGGETYRGRPSSSLVAGQDTSFGRTDLRKLFIDFYNHVQFDWNLYWQRIVSIFQQKIEDFYFGDKRGCLKNLNDLVGKIGSISRDQRDPEKITQMKVKIVRNGDQFYLPNQKKKSQQLPKAVKLSAVDSPESPADFKQIPTTYLKSVFKQMKRVEDSWARGELAEWVDLDHPSELAKIKKKWLMRSLEHVLNLGFRISKEQEALLVGKCFEIFQGSVSKKEAPVYMIGKKASFEDSFRPPGNMKRVNQGETFGKPEFHSNQRFFFSGGKKQICQQAVQDEPESPLCSSLITLFPEMYANQKCVFSLKLEGIFFEKSRIPVELLTSQNDNHRRLLSPLILLPKTELSLSKIRPLEVEDILAVLDDQVKKNRQIYNYFMGGWIDLGQLEPEILRMQRGSTAHCASPGPKDEFIGLPGPGFQTKPVELDPQNEIILKPLSKGASAPLFESPNLFGNQNYQFNSNAASSTERNFLKKLFSLPSKCCFQEEIHLDEKKDQSLLIMRYDDLPPNLRTFISFRPLGQKTLEYDFSPKKEEVSNSNEISKRPVAKSSGLKTSLEPAKTLNLKEDGEGQEQKMGFAEEGVRRGKVSLGGPSPSMNQPALHMTKNRYDFDDESMQSFSQSANSLVNRGSHYGNIMISKRNLKGLYNLDDHRFLGSKGTFFQHFC